MKTISCYNWKLLSFKQGLTKQCLCSHEPTLNVLISTKTEKVEIPSFLLTCETSEQNGLFSWTKNVTKEKTITITNMLPFKHKSKHDMVKKILTSTSCNTNHFDTTCILRNQSVPLLSHARYQCMSLNWYLKLLKINFVGRLVRTSLIVYCWGVLTY